MTARKTATTAAAKPKKTPVINVFERVQIALANLVKFDEEHETYAHEGLQLKVSEDGALLEDDDGNESQLFKTLEQVEAELVKRLKRAELNAPLRVKDLTGDNGDDAEITEDGIAVGCRNVSFKKFDELSAQVAKFRKTLTAKTAKVAKPKKAIPYGEVYSS